MVNPYALRPGRFGMAYVAAAGPIANVVVALVFAAIFRLLDFAGNQNEIVQTVILYTILFNIALAIFNLLPIPPLDGYNLVLPFLPPRQALLVQRYAQYGFVLILLVVVVTRMGGPNPIGWIFEFARDAALALAGVG
jgi:Zn-dependent protease